jgi:glyoxylase-like metal-dependent hydrolase (beta-lactamase superfamily II)
MPEVTRINLWGFVNAYLVREPDGLTLIDTTLPQGAKRILAAARDLDAPIRRIALTHAHGDHIGALDRLHAELPGAEVIIGAREARLLEKDKTLDPGEPQIKLRGGYPGAETRPTRTVADGELIGSLRVIASPGHTPGHVAFMDERGRTLFCGDTLSTLGGMATSARMNPRFPPIYMGTWNRPMVLDSARALRALEPARLAPGHGRVVEDPGAEMDRAIARAS